MAKPTKKSKPVGERDDGTFDLSDSECDPDEIAAMFEQTEDADDGDETGDRDELTAGLESERDEAVAARARAMADLVNYRRRADENEIRARHDGAVRVVRSLMPVLDQFDFALAQAEGDITVEQLLQGVNMIRSELDKALEAQAVGVVAPEVGDEFDPNCHQAVMRELTDDLPPNTIAALLQVGYVVGDTVIRPATVKVAVPADTEE